MAGARQREAVRGQADTGPSLPVGNRAGKQLRSVRISSSFNSQQQNALGYNLSMQGIGDVAIDGPRLEEFLKSRKDFLFSQVGVSQGGLARILLLGCTAGLMVSRGAGVCLLKFEG